MRGIDQSGWRELSNNFNNASCVKVPRVRPRLGLGLY